jgi:hypothetical protein
MSHDILMGAGMITKLQEIADIYIKAKDQIVTEEATKNALIMPFITTLGFNVFNPLEVIPEIVADIGEKKGEKIDYALKSGPDYLMLIECKKCTTPLNDGNISQLFRYFGPLRTKLNVRIAILTNGIEYLFFSDLDNDNILDRVPFFSLDILNLDDQKVADLQQFTKTNFNVEAIITKAGELKRRAAVVGLLESYLTAPTETLVNCILTDMEYPGRKNQQVIATYTSVIQEAFKQLITNRVSGVLRTALNQNINPLAEVEVVPVKSPVSAPAPLPSDDEIFTSPEEIEAFAVIKTILREEVDINRVILRDSKGSCSIILDDTNRKPIIKLYFNDLAKKRIVLYNDRSSKKETQLLIEDVLDIYNYSETIKETVRNYMTANQNLSKQEEDKQDTVS